MSRLNEALKHARDTRRLELGEGVRTRCANTFESQFAKLSALVVADTNTMKAAGAAVAAQLEGSQTLVLDHVDLHAEHGFVERIGTKLSGNDLVPVAVGSGVINDLTKLAAHRAGRPYMCVATAASMDGYSAYGASITHRGVKQTFDCPAPRAILADIDIIRAAPAEMGAAGYADLLAKVPAGADWILADALGVEPIHPLAWQMVQGSLREALADPVGVRNGKADAITKLMEGLLISGIAMQAAQSSRCASGAEHQFSHLWDMEHHTNHGQSPSHGFQVGIGTLAVTRLYEALLDWPIERLDIESAVARWPKWELAERSIREMFEIEAIRDGALMETKAKFVSQDELRRQLTRLRDIWPDLSHRLREQLLPSQRLTKMLTDAGAPTRPEQIGISSNHLRDSFKRACHIRRRFTVLDVVERAGLMDELPGEKQ